MSHKITEEFMENIREQYEEIAATGEDSAVKGFIAKIREDGFEFEAEALEKRWERQQESDK